MDRITVRGALIAVSTAGAAALVVLVGGIAAGSPVPHTHIPGRSISGASTLHGSRDGLLPGATYRVAAAAAIGPAATAANVGAAAATAPPAHAAITTPNAATQHAAAPAAASAPTQPRDIARQLAATRQWTGPQWVCLDKLWLHESKYETTVRNTRSGAYGIPQALPATKMAAAGADWRVNPTTQITWGLGYVAARYGTPCNAWSHWLRVGSY